MSYGQQQYDPRQQAPQGAPADEFYIPAQSYVQQQIDESQREGRGKAHALPKFVKHPVPPGVRSWRETSIGASSELWLWLCPAYAPNRPLGFTYLSHYGRTRQSPQGVRIPCAGDDCLICTLWFELRRNTPEDIKGQVSFLRQKREYLYNVINLTKDHDEDHTVKDGSGNKFRRSAVVSFGAEANRAILKILSVVGVANVCHPHHGLPINYTRERTTREDNGFRYTIVQGGARPLPPGNRWIDLCRPTGMWNLEELNPLPSREEQAAFIRGLGLSPPMMPDAYPAPTYPASGQGQGAPDFGDGYGAQAPAPAQQRGYSAVQGPANPGPVDYGAPPPHSAPPPQDSYAAPAPSYPGGGQSDHPYGAGETEWNAAAEFGEEPPPKYPAPAANQGYRPPQAASQAVPQAAPPGYQAPPQAPQGYQPPPAQQAPSGPPPAPDYGAQPPPAPNYVLSPQGPPQAPSTHYAPVAQQTQAPPPSPAQPTPQAAAASGGQRLVAPLPANIRLPGDRERCFTHFDAQATRCRECPGWIKSQCQPQTQGWRPPQHDGEAQQLEQLQRQMRGG